MDGYVRAEVNVIQQKAHSYLNSFTLLQTAACP